MRESIKLGLILMLIAGCAAGALAVVNYYTEPLIQKQQQKQQEDATQKSLLEVLPENSGGAFVLSNELKELAPAEIRSLFGDVYVAKSSTDGEVTGLAVNVVSKGYASTIMLLVGMNTNGTLTGVRVISQGETPSIGSKITEPKFYAQKAFDGSSVANELKITKDGGNVDTISGATISSRAVVRGINAAFELYRSVATGLGMTY
jgi:electron transport complex protein RnfG